MKQKSKKKNKRNKEKQIKKEKSPNTNWIILLLIALILFHGINNYIVVKTDTIEQLSIRAQYKYTSYRLYDSLKKLDFAEFSENLKSFSPPLVMISSVPMYFIFGKSDTVAVMTNMIYLIVLILSVYGIGSIFHSKKAGLLTAVIVSLFPLIMGFSRVYKFDVAMTTIISLSIYLLLKTDDFNNTLFSILLGLSLGLGVLIRTNFTLYLIIPFIYIALRAFITRKNKRFVFNKNIKRKIINIFLSVILGVLLASLWLVPNHEILKDYASKVIKQNKDLANSYNFDLFGAENLSYYAKNTILAVSYFFFGVFVICFVFFIINKKIELNKKILLLLWIIVPYLVFTFLVNPNKEPRYMLPILPALALIIAIPLVRIRKIKIKAVLICLLVIGGVAQYALASYYQPALFIMHKDYAEHVTEKDVFDFRFAYGLFSPFKEDWKINEIRSTINDSLTEIGEKKRIKNILMITYLQTITIHDLEYYFKDVAVTDIHCFYMDTKECAGKPNKTVNKSDIVLLSNMKIKNELYVNVYNSFFEEFQKQENEFELKKTFELPEGYTYNIYQRKRNE